MKAIRVLSWSTFFPLQGRELKADWATYEGEDKEGCLSLHGLSAEEAENIVKVLYSLEDLRTGKGGTRQTNFGSVLEEEAQNKPPTHVAVISAGSGGSAQGSNQVVPVGADMFPEAVCATTDFRVVLRHWVSCGVTDRAELLQLAEKNRDRLVSLAVVKDVRKKFNSMYPSIQVPAAE